MTSSGDRPDSGQLRDHPVQQQQRSPGQLALARRIARQALAADHQAVEVNAKLVLRSHSR